MVTQKIHCFIWAPSVPRRNKIKIIDRNFVQYVLGNLRATSAVRRGFSELLSSPKPRGKWCHVGVKLGWKIGRGEISFMRKSKGKRSFVCCRKGRVFLCNRAWEPEKWFAQLWRQDKHRWVDVSRRLICGGGAPPQGRRRGKGNKYKLC